MKENTILDETEVVWERKYWLRENHLEFEFHRLQGGWGLDCPHSSIFGHLASNWAKLIFDKMPWISVSRPSLVVEDWNQVISIDEDFTSILGVDAQAAFLSNMFTSKIWWTDVQLRSFKILLDGQGSDSSLFFTVHTKWYNDYLWAHLQHFLIVFCWGPLICSLKILI